MADTSHTAVPAGGNPRVESTLAFRAKYHAYRYAKAQWDLLLYAPSMLDRDAPEAEDERLSDAHTAALFEVLQHPASSIALLARKLAVFRDEEVYDYDRAAEIVACLAADANRLVNPSKEA